MIEQFLKRVEQREAKIGIVGLGYVGLPLAIEFSQAGFEVLGLDVDSDKIESLKRSETECFCTHIQDR